MQHALFLVYLMPMVLFGGAELSLKNLNRGGSWSGCSAAS